MAANKWYEVSEEQEQAVIHQKKAEWFPNAQENDWKILGHFFLQNDLKKQNYSILLKDAVKYFNPPSPSEVKKFCAKFHYSIISLAGNAPYVQIGRPGYQILINESFKDLRETKYWLPDLQNLLIENQTDRETIKAEYPENELFKHLVECQSNRQKDSIIKSGLPQLIRQPKIYSFIVSEVAYYYPTGKEEPLISIQRSVIEQNPDEWYDGFLKSHFDIFENIKTPVPETIKTVEIKPTKTGSKIFISCGQYQEHERTLGKKLVELVDKLTLHNGYFAQNQTSLNGLSENIFNELNNCMGLVVVMHGRGTITTPDGKTINRASVWIEQEIAIASFIQTVLKKEINVVLFAENGISIEGVRSQIHLNPIVFDKNEEVLDKFQEIILSGKFGTAIPSVIESKSRPAVVNDFLKRKLLEIEPLISSDSLEYKKIQELHEKIKRAIRASLGENEVRQLLSLPGVVPNPDGSNLQTSLVRHKEYLKSKIGNIFSDNLLKEFEVVELEEH